MMAAVLRLAVVETFWSPAAKELNALLFVAKVHGSHIVALLFHSVYYRIRRELPRS